MHVPYFSSILAVHTSPSVLSPSNVCVSHILSNIFPELWQHLFGVTAQQEGDGIPLWSRAASLAGLGWLLLKGAGYPGPTIGGNTLRLWEEEAEGPA